VQLAGLSPSRSWWTSAISRQPQKSRNARVLPSSWRERRGKIPSDFPAFPWWKYKVRSDISAYWRYLSSRVAAALLALRRLKRLEYAPSPSPCLLYDFSTIRGELCLRMQSGRKLPGERSSYPSSLPEIGYRNRELMTRFACVCVQPRANRFHSRLCTQRSTISPFRREERFSFYLLVNQSINRYYELNAWAT